MRNWWLWDNNRRSQWKMHLLDWLMLQAMETHHCCGHSRICIDHNSNYPSELRIREELYHKLPTPTPLIKHQISALSWLPTLDKNLSQKSWETWWVQEVGPSHTQGNCSLQPPTPTQAKHEVPNRQVSHVASVGPSNSLFSAEETETWGVQMPP